MGSDSGMEAKRNNYYQNNRTSYVEGNTVRKLNTVPDIRREEQPYEQPYEQPSRRRREQNQPKTLSAINFASLLVLIVAISITVFMCYEYLTLQASVSHLNSRAKELQKELVTSTKDNDAAMDKLKAAVDLDKVYQIAVGDYGMVYPNKNKIISFDSSDGSHVTQYEDIPQK